MTELAYREADILTPVCAYNANWENALGVARERIRVIYNGLDDSRMGGQAPTSATTAGPLTIGYVARLDPLKDVVTLVRALSLVRRMVPDVRLRIRGPASSAGYLAHCQQVARSLCLSDVVTFEGPTSDLPNVYGACHVIALPSVTEGFPYTVVESMLAARPIVATDVGGVAEALGDIRVGETSLLVEPGDPQSMAEALLAVLLAPEPERMALGWSLRARALERFSAARFRTAYEKVYEELAGAGAKQAYLSEAG